MKISINTAKEILDLFSIVPQYKTGGFSHFEEIQLYVNNISKDRISDFACNFLKSFLIDFTQDECKKYKATPHKWQNPSNCSSRREDSMDNL